MNDFQFDADVVAVIAVEDAFGIVPEVVHFLLVQYAVRTKLVHHIGGDEHGKAKLKNLSGVMYYTGVERLYGSLFLSPSCRFSAGHEAGIARGVYAGQVLAPAKTMLGVCLL